MKVVMILPPQAIIPGLIANVLSPGSYTLFLDAQAEVVDLDMKRYLVEHQIPGREGGILQDLGSSVSTISLKGKWIYENRPNDDIKQAFPTLPSSEVISWNWMRLEIMKAVYRLKFPLFLASDLITTAVMIEHMHFRYVGGAPNVYEYDMVLKEFSPVLTVIGSIAQGFLSVVPNEQEEMGY